MALSNADRLQEKDMKDTKSLKTKDKALISSLKKGFWATKKVDPFKPTPKHKPSLSVDPERSHKPSKLTDTLFKYNMVSCVLVMSFSPHSLSPVI